MMNNPMMNINNPMMNMNNPMMNMNNPMMNMNLMNANNPMIYTNSPMMNMNNPMMNMNMMNMNNPMMNINMMNMMSLFQNNLSGGGNSSNYTNNSQMKNNSKLGRLPRDKSTNYYSPFIHENNDNYFNIVFSTPSGNKTIIGAPPNINVYELLCKYMEKIGLGPNLISNGIYFLYGGRKLKKEDYNVLISQFFLNANTTHIIVLDAGNLIGA